MINKFIIAVLSILLISACDNGADTSSEQAHWYDDIPRASWQKFTMIDTGQDWFEVYKLTDNTYAIYEPNQWQEAISYLLIGTEKAMLIDSLQGIGDLKTVIDQLTDLPIIVINTHSHYDHVSGNYQFDTIYGLDEPYTAANALGHGHADYINNMTKDTFLKTPPDIFSFEFYQSKAYQIDKFVKDGDIINLGEREIKLVRTPGHSPDSLILVDKANRMMMTGDSFYPAPIYLYSETSSFADFFMSAQIMFSYRDDVDFLLPGHNETMLPAASLNKLRMATLDIINPITPFEQDGMTRIYSFENFKIIVKDPLDMGFDKVLGE